MVLKIYPLSGSIAAGATWTRIAELTTPSRTKRALQELRAWCSATSSVRIRIYAEKEFIAELTAENIGKYPYPYPMSVVLAEGQTIYVEANNPTTSSASVILELVVDETTA